MVTFFGLLGMAGSAAVMLDSASLHRGGGIAGFGVCCLLIAAIGAFCVCVAP